MTTPVRPALRAVDPPSALDTFYFHRQAMLRAFRQLTRADGVTPADLASEIEQTAEGLRLISAIEELDRHG